MPAVWFRVLTAWSGDASQPVALPGITQRPRRDPGPPPSGSYSRPMKGAEQSSPHTDPAENARAADEDREAIAETLRIAAGEGRINLEELNERLYIKVRQGRRR
jgi:Domain of unknown function (DUF1707)